MVKTTKKECKNNAQFTNLKELKKFIKENNYKIKQVNKIAYCESIYGCGGYLIELQTNVKNFSIMAFTDRSTWMYNCESLEQYNKAEA